MGEIVSMQDTQEAVRTANFYKRAKLAFDQARAVHGVVVAARQYSTTVHLLRWKRGLPLLAGLSIEQLARFYGAKPSKVVPEVSRHE
jgi:hypothetical protein